MANSLHDQYDPDQAIHQRVNRDHQIRARLFQHANNIAMRREVDELCQCIDTVAPIGELVDQVVKW